VKRELKSQINRACDSWKFWTWKHKKRTRKRQRKWMLCLLEKSSKSFLGCLVFLFWLKKEKEEMWSKSFVACFKVRAAARITHSQRERRQLRDDLSFPFPFSIQSGADAYYFYHSGDPNTSPTTIINLLYSKSNLVLLV